MKKLIYTSLAAGLLSTGAIAGECVNFLPGIGIEADNCFKGESLEGGTVGACYQALKTEISTWPEETHPTDVSNDQLWKEIPCPTAEESSSSEEAPAVSSSSVETLTESSSSVEVMSVSSSSEPVITKIVEKCVDFDRENANYHVDCYKSGLNGMDDGACYGLNPERADFNDKYINQSAFDSYWWVKVDCTEEVVVTVEDPASSSSCDAATCGESSSSKNTILVPKCIEYVGGNYDYLTNCFNAGLHNIDEGKCYAFNDERKDVNNGPWVNDNAADKWWWHETECFEEVEAVESSSSEPELSSSSIEEGKIVVTVEKCVDFDRENANYHVDCYKSGLNGMDDGACYGLNPERADFNDKYINQSAFDSYWWVKVDCTEEVVVDASSSSIDEGTAAESSSSSVDEGTVAESSSSSVDEGSVAESSSSSVDEGSVAESSSSSVDEPSSSSVEVVLVSACEKYVGGNTDYLTKCFNDGLHNIEEGKCYAFNVEERMNDNFDRNWVNDNAADKWWWHEVSCFKEVIVVAEESSSSVEESSSSVEESSSSVEESSSSVEESSSSVELVEVCVPFVYGSDAYLTECFNGGDNFYNVEEGKCYRFKNNLWNPAWGNWINNNAQDTYWWDEVSCYADNAAPKARPNAPVFDGESTMNVVKSTLEVSAPAGMKKLSIFDAQGNLVASESFSAMNSSIDLSKYAGKVLIVRLANDSKLVSTKRVVVR